MISYRSANEWAHRFGRKKSSKDKITQNTFGIENTGFEFEIESYLEHLAIKFQDVFDANCYLYLSRSIDWFDIIDYGPSSKEVLSKTGLESALILGVNSDILFPIDQQKELAECLSADSTKVTYKSLDCMQGHDSFLVDTETFSREISCYLKKFLVLLLLVIAVPSYGDQYSANVIKVIDGDTIWVKTDNKHIKIRLSYIDAPELKQTHGVRSRDFLIDILLDKKVQVNTNKKDRYNRHLGEIYIHDNEESIFVNAKMLKSGNAWVYKSYRNNMYLKNLENHARIKKLGIWSETEPIEPWIFRRK